MTRHSDAQLLAIMQRGSGLASDLAAQLLDLRRAHERLLAVADMVPDAVWDEATEAVRQILATTTGGAA